MIQHGTSTLTLAARFHASLEQTAERITAISDWHARVGQRVADFRAAHGLTLAEMAGRIGCGGPERLAAIEAGTDDIRLDDLERVGAVIGCEMPELLEADESEWMREG